MYNGVVNFFTHFEKENKTMKKFLALLLALTMALSLIACGSTETAETATPTEAATEAATEAPVEETEAPVEETEAPAVSYQADIPEEDVISYADYAAAEVDTLVTIETIIQAKQSWWNDQATFYTQDADGAYFIYNMPCSQEEYEQMSVGTKIRVSGYKSEWAGEVEIVDAQFQILESEDTYYETLDITEMLGEDLLPYQNQMIFLKEATVVACNDAGDAFMYGWDGSGEPGTDADLYFTVAVGEETMTLVVEYYLCDSDGNYGEYTDFYKTVQGLSVGDKLDIHAFLYWYEGAQPHVSGIMCVG